MHSDQNSDQLCDSAGREKKNLFACVRNDKCAEFFIPLKVGPTGRLETSVGNYNSTLRKIPKELRSHYVPYSDGFRVNKKVKGTP
jgi:hypothetical protein